MTGERPPLAMTMGDPAGIGPELALAAWRAAVARRRAVLSFSPRRRISPRSRGASASTRRSSKRSPPSAASRHRHGACPSSRSTIRSTREPGRPDAAQRGGDDRIDRARGRRRCATGEARAVVTNPIAKAVLYERRLPLPGPYRISRGAREGLGRARVSRHDDLVGDAGRRAGHDPYPARRSAAGAERRNSSSRPRGSSTAIFAPGSASLGRASPSPASIRTPAKAARWGARRSTIIAPAIEAAARRRDRRRRPDARRHDVSRRTARARYDVALTMYHDQGLIPVKTLAFDEGVNVTLGLPFVRTSPDHGTAFDIAGKGLANPASLIAALEARRPADAMTLAADGLPPLREVVARSRARRPQGARPEFPVRPQSDAQDRARRRAARRRRRRRGRARSRRPDPLAPRGRRREGDRDRTRRARPAGARRDRRALAGPARGHRRRRADGRAGDAAREGRRRAAPDLRQPALQHRDRAARRLARGRALAAVLRPADLMFQREVALRIVATPAERADYGRLGVLAGWRTQARILFDVPPAAFTPPPKVTSSVVELIPRAAPDPCDAATALRRDPGRLRPAAQDAAPVAERLRRGARPRPLRRCSPRPGSSRPCGRKRSRSRASPRSPGPASGARGRTGRTVIGAETAPSAAGPAIWKFLASRELRAN